MKCDINLERNHLLKFNLVLKHDFLLPKTSKSEIKKAKTVQPPRWGKMTRMEWKDENHQNKALEKTILIQYCVLRQLQI